tara:strand:+ start:163 stop:306 length:144 start_codon:yes stop_codon:yes gene_type:complete
MDTVNEIIKIVQEKLKQKEYDEKPEVEEKEKKKPKKTEKQIFFIPNK